MLFRSVSGLRWVHLDEGPSTLEQVAETAAWVRTHTDENRPLLTVQTTVAVEADRRVPTGLEMGRFGWTEEDVKRAMGPTVGGAVIAEGDFSRAPALRASVITWAADRFPMERTEDGFGQVGETLPLVAPSGGTVLSSPPCTTSVGQRIRGRELSRSRPSNAAMFWISCTRSSDCWIVMWSPISG